MCTFMQKAIHSLYSTYKTEQAKSSYWAYLVCLHSHNNVTPMRKSKGRLWATYLSHMYSVRDYFTS